MNRAALSLILPIFFSGYLFAQQDTAAKAPKIFKYPRKTVFYGGLWHKGDTVRHTLDGLSHWDEIDGWAGFTWRLGMVGKAFLNHRYGLSGAYLPTPYFRSPATLYPDPYVLDPALNLPFFDTRTPYAIVGFDQAGRQSQFFSFTLSQNVRPWWNATVHYKRRSAVGAYPDALTDHYNIGFSQRFAYRRFVAVVGAAYNQLNDGQNGGVFQDGTIPFEFLFDKAAQQMRFQGASLKRRVRGLYAGAGYDLLKDSLNTLALGGDVRLGDALYRYNDPVEYSPEAINTAPFHPYGGTNVTVRFNERWNLNEAQARAGAVFDSDGKKFDLALKSFFHFHRRAFSGNIDARQQKTGLTGELEMTWTERKVDFSFEAAAEYFVNNLFPAEYRLGGRLSAGFFAREYVLTDSVEHWRPERVRGARSGAPAPDTHRVRRTPLRLVAGADLRSQNPTFMAAYGESDHRERTLGLSNELPAVFLAGLEYLGKPDVRRRMAFDPDRIGVEVFVSRLNSPVYFNAWAQTRQAGSGDGVTRVGATAYVRQRVGRVYLANETTWQTSAASSLGLAPYARSLPDLFGKASVYFKGPIPKIPLILYAGVDWTYFTAYDGFHFHPAYQLFYPRARVRLPAYSYFDVYVQAQIKTVRFFFKLHHVNEGIFVPGFYTVTHYPMLERTFAFGVKWHFYD